MVKSLEKVREKNEKVREKSGKSQGILKSTTCGNHANINEVSVDNNPYVFWFSTTTWNKLGPIS